LSLCFKVAYNNNISVLFETKSLLLKLSMAVLKVYTINKLESNFISSIAQTMSTRSLNLKCRSLRKTLGYKVDSSYSSKKSSSSYSSVSSSLIGYYFGSLF
jgi:hypothetical protein